MLFKNRNHAGQMLAHALEKYRGKETVILALPRGGVILGYEIAKHLRAPLWLAVAQKIPHPLSPEYAIGAVTKDGTMILSESARSEVDPQWLARQRLIKQKEAIRRYDTYLHGMLPPKISESVAILVDDGLATGLTMRAAIADIKKFRPKIVVVAIPVGSNETVDEIRKEVDDILCLHIPPHLGAISTFYQDFNQVSDEQVLRVLSSLSF